MIDAKRFRELVELWERASLNRPAFDADGDKYAEARYQVAEMRLLHFVTSHAAELLSLVEASNGKPMLIDGDERSSVRIFTPAPETAP